MQAHFILGPAGSGKTVRCLGEIRRELLRAPDGPPLLLLAPKQATFQLERQLLGSPDPDSGMQLFGYSRLQILSFDRLAQYILGELAAHTGGRLDDEGRVMVLRALLAQRRSQLRMFHATARLPGFATRLSRLLRELQHEQISPNQLLALSEKISGPAQLCDKLHDFALLLRGYQDWLEAHELQDTESALDEATAILHTQSRSAQPGFQLAGLWMDGFAELTAQELDLLAAVVPLSERATLAFCLPAEITDEPSWLSTWSVIGQTYLRCRQRISTLTEVRVTTETLPRQTQGRFANTPELAHLESSWPQHSHAPQSSPAPSAALRCFSCTNPEMEAVLAAREIRRFIREGGRYRETAVLVRSLDGYAGTLRRVFQRYEIPFFLDRREPVSHHPLAELTRYALRTAAYDWQHADWFGALKTGLVPAVESEVDWIENLALEHGWEGNVWLQPLSVPADPAFTERAERLRAQIISPFIVVSQQTADPITGAQLAGTLRAFWDALGVAATLEEWTSRLATSQSSGDTQPAPHATVLDQMQSWLDNLERAFPAESLPLRDWLPILEAGLATLSVGVIPPTIDQVLIGAIDRSRNPDLKLALVLGLNEGVFPARPAEDPLLTELERDAMSTAGARLGAGLRRRLGHEWFYGYIALTRASQRLVLSCAQSDARGNKLNRSPFFDHLAKLFPDLKPEPWQPPPPFSEPEHLCEVVVPAVQLLATGEGINVKLGKPLTRPSATLSPSDGERDGVRGIPGNHDIALDATGLLALPELAGVINHARQVAEAGTINHISPGSVETLHGRELATSVSALENFAACPFKFFVSHGLRAQERRQFDLDSRERGSFQHEVLSAFHNELLSEQRQWRDLTPDEARTRIRRIGEGLIPTYRNGLLNADVARRFSGETLLRSLETLIAVLIGWAREYQFDPALVETGFGLKDAPWPAWRIDLDNGRALRLRGRIDRVDVWRDPATGAALAVVMDYKSSSRKPDRVKLLHGLQLQLPAYLAALEQLPEVRVTINATTLVPAGVFYVNLRGEFASARSRADALADPASALREGFIHTGRYNESHLAQFDPGGQSGQFKTGTRSHDRMDSTAFRDLLNRAVENLRRFGNEIYSGSMSPSPFRKGNETACDFCDYASICRFDPWTQPFRPLKSADE